MICLDSKIIVPSGTVYAVIDGDKANATLTQDFHNLTDFQIVTTFSFSRC